MSEQAKKLHKTVGIIEKAVLAWDPDFTKLTPEEAAALKQSEAELENGEVFSIDEIDWS